MKSQQYEKYKQLAQKLLREQPTLSIIEESHILEEMDKYWQEMSEAECIEIEQEIAEAKKIAKHLK